MNEKDGEKFAAKVFKKGSEERTKNTVLIGKNKLVRFEVESEAKLDHNNKKADLSCKSITEVDAWEFQINGNPRYLGKCTHTWHFLDKGHLITDEDARYPNHHPVCKISKGGKGKQRPQLITR